MFQNPGGVEVIVCILLAHLPIIAGIVSTVLVAYIYFTVPSRYLLLLLHNLGRLRIRKMAKSRRPKKTTTKKPASMPTLARPSPLEPSTASNVQVPTRDAYEDFTDTASLTLSRPHRTNLGPHNQHPPARSGPSNRMPRDAGQDYTDGAHEPGLLPPPTSIDPLDPRFRAAWQEWTANALGRLDQLPKLTQNQLAAIARAAAAGVGAGAGGQLLQGASDSNTGALTVPGEGGQQVLGIDLPASLAALFEAKLTLDREKAKLVRMQKELQGYRAVAGRQKE